MTSRNYIHEYAEPLPGGRGILRHDFVVDSVLVDSHLVGSPAPWLTVKAAESFVDLDRVPNGGVPEWRHP